MEQVVNVKITAVPLYAQAFFLLLGGKRFPAERCRRLFNTFATKIRKILSGSERITHKNLQLKIKQAPNHRIMGLELE